jgi:hypothetical protein
MNLNRMGRSALFLFFCTLMACQVYTFKGISIDAATKTYFVTLFTNSTTSAPPTIGQTFSEKLKDRIRNNTRLARQDNDADLQFTGNVSEYIVVSQAVQPGQQAAYNQLRIAVEVEQVNSKNEKGGWKQTFTFQSDFSATQDILTVQNELIKKISDKIVDDIFNKAFTENW